MVLATFGLLVAARSFREGVRVRTPYLPDPATLVSDIDREACLFSFDPGALLAAACYAVLGWNVLVYGFCLSVVLVFQVTFAVNSIGHLWGGQRFETGEGSRNNMVLGYLAMGDGWHNNHHRAPSSARHGFAWYELDMSYNFIVLLRRLGLEWDVIQPPASAWAGRDRRTPAPAAACGDSGRGRLAIHTLR